MVEYSVPPAPNVLFASKVTLAATDFGVIECSPDSTMKVTSRQKMDRAGINWGRPCRRRRAP